MELYQRAHDVPHGGGDTPLGKVWRGGDRLKLLGGVPDGPPQAQFRDQVYVGVVLENVFEMNDVEGSAEAAEGVHLQVHAVAITVALDFGDGAVQDRGCRALLRDPLTRKTGPTTRKERVGRSVRPLLVCRMVGWFMMREDPPGMMVVRWARTEQTDLGNKDGHDARTRRWCVRRR